jgi:hypothetical protein
MRPICSVRAERGKQGKAEGDYHRRVSCGVSEDTSVTREMPGDIPVQFRLSQ